MKGLSPYKVLTLQKHRPVLVDERIKRSSLPGLGLPKEALQRRATQIESRHLSTPYVRTPFDSAIANEKASVSRSATLSHMQLISGPLHETAYLSTKQENKGNALPDMSNQSSKEEVLKADVVSPTSAHANRSTETSDISTSRNGDENKRTASDVPLTLPDSSVQSTPDVKEVIMPKSPMDPEPEREPQSLVSPSHGRLSNDASLDATSAASPLRIRAGGVRGPRGPRKTSR